MYDVALVCLIERARNLNGNIHSTVQRKHAGGGDFLGKRFAFNVFHRDEEYSIHFIDFINCANVRMIQRRSCLRFHHKPLFAFLIGGKFGRQYLDGNHSLQTGVHSFINDPHTPFTQLPYDPVV